MLRPQVSSFPGNTIEFLIMTSSGMVTSRPKMVIAEIFCQILNLEIEPFLRVVQTQTISFLKSLSKRFGSDIERHRILNDFSYLYRLKID